MANLSDDRLLRISKAPKATIDAWREGISIEGTAGMTLSDIACRVACDRWRLGSEHLAHAQAQMRKRPKLNRAAVSRAYYGMYHFIRASTFIHFGGDDHEEHRKLPAAVPDDFPNRDVWSNALKSAREHRNRADYDPYLTGSLSWLRMATDVVREAAALEITSKTYLKTKGCIIP